MILQGLFFEYDAEIGQISADFEKTIYGRAQTRPFMTVDQAGGIVWMMSKQALDLKKSLPHKTKNF